MTTHIEKQWGPTMKTAQSGDVFIRIGKAGNTFELVFQKSVEPEGFALSDFEREEDDLFEEVHGFFDETYLSTYKIDRRRSWDMYQGTLFVSVFASVKANDPRATETLLRDVATDYGWPVGRL